MRTESDKHGGRTRMVQTWAAVGAAALLLLFRTYVGAQINFSHEDYDQVYLMGLQNALTDAWSYWGPDVVWSRTRLPGALQGLLVGVPLWLTRRPYAPLVLTNLITCAGLMLLAFYAARRFPRLSLPFLVALVLLLPFGLFNGAVVLNTAYLLFSGSILFVAVLELFVYRERPLFDPRLSWAALGFALVFTCQLHLTWVMCLPFVVVLLGLEWQRRAAAVPTYAAYFLLGWVPPLLTLLPTILTYGDVMMVGTSGNLRYDGGRVLGVFDLLFRYFSMASVDLTHRHNFVRLLTENHAGGAVLVWVLKGLFVAQVIALAATLLFAKRSEAFKRTLLLFGLTTLMALFLYVLSNKHLSMRTYILLFPVPVWLTLFAYDHLLRYRAARVAVAALLLLSFGTTLAIAAANHHGPYSFAAAEGRIERALRTGDPQAFGERRKTLMDAYD
ncbi:MAG: hypothetical protein WBA12_00820 [Catalinimonas sp.]